MLTTSHRWWVTGLILHRYDLGWLIPFLLFLCITIWLLSCYFHTTLISNGIGYMWANTAGRMVSLTPDKWKAPVGATLVIILIVVVTFSSPESFDNSRQDRAVSLLGLFVFLFVLWLTSKDRSLIKWHTVIVGILVQFMIGLFILKTSVGVSIYLWMIPPLLAIRSVNPQIKIYVASLYLVTGWRDVVETRMC